MSAQPHRLTETARSAGPLPDNAFRVVVEEGQRTTHRDFADLDTAKQYANDAAAEHNAEPMTVIVFDTHFAVVHTGRGYFA